MRPMTWATGAVLPFMLALGFAAAPAHASPFYRLKTLIAVPPSADNTDGGKFTAFDISFFDPTTQLDYVADRSNASVDIFSAKTDTFVGRVGGTGHLFTGHLPSSDVSGPDGVLVANGFQLWVGNGNSDLHGFDIKNSYATLPHTPILTGPPTDKRVDEMAFDPGGQRLLVVNDAATPSPFISLIDTTTNTIAKQTTFNGTNGAPLATGGLEQPFWDKATQKFYVSVPQVGGTGPGAIAQIDPTTGLVTHTFNLAGFGIGTCGPTGLTGSGGGQLMIACGAVGSQAILFDTTANGGSGAVLKTYAQVNGSDEAWFDPTSNRYFVTGASGTPGPVLGIIDALTGAFLQDLVTVPGAHSVAVDPISGQVFVPFGGVAGNTACPDGCIAVFATPEPSSAWLMLVALLGLTGLAVQRRRRSA